MASPLDSQLVYVTGKGGVGRSTVSAALGLASAARGRRTLICEVALQDRMSRVFGRQGSPGEEVELDENLWALPVDPHQALREYLSKQLGSLPLTRLLYDNDAFQYFVAAAPGAREMVTIAKVWELTQSERWTKGSRHYDLVVVDAPATGHALAMLNTPKTFADIARVGPIHRQAGRVQELLSDRKRTSYLAVALPEEMPVNETLDLEDKLKREVGVPLSGIVVNALYPRRFSAAEVESLSEADRDGRAVGAAVAAARAEHHWARGQHRQLTRLRRAAKAPVVTLPFVFERQLDLDALRRLASELEEKLG